MRHTKKVLILMLALMLVLGTIGAAHAAYDFSTTISTYGETHDTKSKAISTVKSRWKIILSGSNLSSNNVFGARLRKEDGETSVSSYHTYTSSGTYSHSYYSNANLKKGDSVFLRYKKDDSSSYGEPLNISGSFEP